MKKIISMALSLLLVFGFVLSSTAAQTDAGKLKFNSDGKFTIIHYADIQDTYPMNATAKQFIAETIAEIKPDLVVLGGDNTVGPKETKPQAIKELCDLFVESETYFTFVFGNHDNEQGVDKETLLGYYQQFGGEYCLAYDAVPELYGVATHNLPVYSSDNSKVAYNLFLIDSNTYTGDADGSGYDCVHADQVQWYKNTAEAYKAQNGGKVVPSMVFQHIIVQEIYDALFIEAPGSIGAGTQLFKDAKGEKHYYTYLPKVANIKEGLIYEAPCPGYLNYGQFDAMVEEGDVKAIFCGHDHTNSFVVNIDGIDVVNTSGVTFHSYGKAVNRGCRVIVIDENDTSTYESYTYTATERGLKDGSKLFSFGDITKADAISGRITKLLADFIVKVCGILFFFVK